MADQGQAVRAARQGRLLARPGADPKGGVAGLHPLELGVGRDGFCYVPPTVRADRPAPLMLWLHGAGGNAARSLASARPIAEEAGAILLVPESRADSWDVIRGGFGPDIAF